MLVALTSKSLVKVSISGPSVIVTFHLLVALTSKFLVKVSLSGPRVIVTFHHVSGTYIEVFGYSISKWLYSPITHQKALIFGLWVP